MIFHPAIGLSTGCFYDRPIAGCLGAVRDAGFATVEICSHPSHLDYHDEPACRHAAGLLRQLELEPYSFHAPFAPHIDITALDGGARQHATDELLRAADAAATLGVRFYVIHPGPETGEIPYGERMRRMENAAHVLDRVADHCRHRDLSLVLENMLPHLFAGPVRDLMWLLGALRATDVGICLDTGHAFLTGDLGLVAHKLSGHLWMLHASDNRGSFDDHLPPGEGHIAWDDLLRQLAARGFRGTIILEIAGRADTAGVLHDAQRARTFLRRLAGRLSLIGTGIEAGSTAAATQESAGARASP